jgi:hypothetical protein
MSRDRCERCPELRHHPPHRFTSGDVLSVIVHGVVFELLYLLAAWLSRGPGRGAFGSAADRCRSDLVASEDPVDQRARHVEHLLWRHRKPDAVRGQERTDRKVSTAPRDGYHRVPRVPAYRRTAPHRVGEDHAVGYVSLVHQRQDRGEQAADSRDKANGCSRWALSRHTRRLLS